MANPGVVPLAPLLGPPSIHEGYHHLVHPTPVISRTTHRPPSREHFEDGSYRKEGRVKAVDLPNVMIGHLVEVILSSPPLALLGIGVQMGLDA